MSSDSITIKHNQADLEQCWRCG